MATAAVTPLASSVEKTNGAKLNRLLIDGGTTVLRKAFDCYHPPAGLATDLNTYKPLLMKLFRKKFCVNLSGKNSFHRPEPLQIQANLI